MSDKKQLEVISGDGSNLDISPVYDHLTAAKPKSTNSKPKNIVIPKVKSNKKVEEKDLNQQEKK